MKSRNIWKFQMNTIEEFLEFAAKSPRLTFSDEIYSNYEDDNFIFVFQKHEKLDEVLVSMDFKAVFNKASQAPIHFILPIKGRKLKRLKQAIKFLVENKKIAGTFFGRLPGFDDFDSTVLFSFYYKKS